MQQNQQMPIEEQIAYFLPKSFKIGLFQKSPTDCWGQPSGKTVEAGFPSCRFKCGDWTDVTLFEKLTGYRPTVQKDRIAEIEKTATGSVSEVENVPTSGFRVAGYSESLYAAGHSYGSDVTLRDPRGWCVPFDAHRFFRLLTGGKVSVSENGELVGVSFLYVWSPRCTFSLVESDSDEVRRSIGDDYYEKERAIGKKRLKQSELVVGRVYELATGKSKFSCTPNTKRAVYLGKIRASSVREYDAVRYSKFVTSPDSYKDGLRKQLGSSYYSFPWECSEWAESVGAFKRGKRSERHAFMILEDHFHPAYGYFVGDYLDHYLGDGRDDFALKYSGLALFDSAEGKVVSESDDQRIRPSGNPCENPVRNASKVPQPACYIPISDYSEYSVEELVTAIRKRNEKMTRVVSAATRSFPVEKPSNLMEWLDEEPSVVADGNRTTFRKK